MPVTTYCNTDARECQEVPQKNSLEVLSDKSGSGRERPWVKMKMDSTYISFAYENINPSKAARVCSCASFLAFRKDESGKKRLVASNFCHVRMCPMCGWRRSLKTHAQMKKILAYVAEHEKTKPAYIFLTVTVENCLPEKLSETLDAMLKGFNKFNQRAAFKKAVVGWYRGLEVTHNVAKDTYHPHIHFLLMVSPSYFKQSYLSKAKWRNLWKSVMGLGYDPQVYVERCYGSDDKVVSEIAKYTTKVNEILNYNDWVMTENTLLVLDAALHHRRLVAFGGKFKEYHKILELDDVEDGDFTNVSGDEKGTEHGDEEYYFWHTGYCQYLLE